MIALIYGGRDWLNRKRTFEELDRLHEDHSFTQVIHGGARGADTLGGDWGKSRNIPVRVFPAKWRTHQDDCDARCRNKSYCPKAGFIRNQQMLTVGRPDLVIGFPGGNGTADTTRKAREQGFQVILVTR